MVTDSSILRLRSKRSTHNGDMICVTVFAHAKQYKGIELLGHAGNAHNPVDGQELVCSAVSALTLNMANSVEHFTEDSFVADTDEETGRFRFDFSSSDVSLESQLLMNSLVLGLQDIEEAYGEPYIKIRFKEV